MAESCPIVGTINIIGKRWHLTVLRYLMDGPRRFSELKRDMDGVSSRTLSATLGRLVEEGIVHREVGHQSPISVHYGLTPKGRELVTVLQPMARWGERWLGGGASRSRPGKTDLRPYGAVKRV